MRASAAPSCLSSELPKQFVETVDAKSFSGLLALRKTPPTPTARPRSLLPLYHLLELWLVFSLAAGARCILNNSRSFGLTHALACICLHSLGGRKCASLAFRHCKDEYGIVRAEAEVPGTFICAGLSEEDLHPGLFSELEKRGTWTNGSFSTRRRRRGRTI